MTPVEYEGQLTLTSSARRLASAMALVCLTSCKSSTAPQSGRLTVFPPAGVILDLGSAVLPVAFLNGSWAKPDRYDWCRKTDNPAVVGINRYVDPFAGQICLLVGLAVGATAVHFQLGADTATVLVSVDSLPWTLGPPGGYTWWSSAIVSSSVAYLAGEDRNCGCSVLFRLDLNTGAVTQVPGEIGSATGGAVVINSSGTMLYNVSGGYVVRVNPATATAIDSLVTTPPVANRGAIYTAVLDSRDSMLFVGGGGRIFAVNVFDTLRMAWDDSINGLGVWLAVTNDDRHLFATMFDPTGFSRHVISIDPATGAIAAGSFPVDTLVQGIAVSPDGTRLYAGSEAGPMYSCPVSMGACESTDVTSYFPWHQLTVSQDGSKLYAIATGPTFFGGSGGVAILDATSLEPEAWIGLPSNPSNWFGYSPAVGIYVMSNGHFRHVVSGTP